MEYCFLNEASSTYCLPTDTDSNSGSSNSICLPAPVMYAYSDDCITPYGSSRFYRYDSNSRRKVFPFTSVSVSLSEFLSPSLLSPFSQIGSFSEYSDSSCSSSTHSYRLPYSECMGCNRFKDLANDTGGGNAGLAAGIIAGIVIGVVCGCALCVFCCSLVFIPGFAVSVGCCRKREPPPVVYTPPPPPASSVNYGQPAYGQPIQPAYHHQQPLAGYPQQSAQAYSPGYGTQPSAPPAYGQASANTSLVSPSHSLPRLTHAGVDHCPSPGGCKTWADHYGSEGEWSTGGVAPLLCHLSFTQSLSSSPLSDPSATACRCRSGRHHPGAGLRHTAMKSRDRNVKKPSLR
jgi:hypothetical protein